MLCNKAHDNTAAIRTMEYYFVSSRHCKQDSYQWNNCCKCSK